MKKQPTSQRPQLLVSVQNEWEACQIRDVPVDIVDFKAPQLGPLAPVDASLWNWAAKNLASHALSAALGESDQAVRQAASLPPSFAFAKMGISGIRNERMLVRVWRDLQAALPATTALVAVAYADDHNARCLPPERVFSLASEMGLRWALIDTFSKRARSTIQTLGWHRLRSIVDAARSRNQFITIAGSIRVNDLRAFNEHRIHPHAFGVRGDLCIGPRSGAISRDRVSRWLSAIANSRGGASWPFARDVKCVSHGFDRSGSRQDFRFSEP